MGFQEREEALLRKQKINSDVLSMSSLTLEEELPSVEEVLPKTSISKVGPPFPPPSGFPCVPLKRRVPVSACAGVLLRLR